MRVNKGEFQEKKNTGFLLEPFLVSGAGAARFRGGVGCPPFAGGARAANEGDDDDDADDVGAEAEAACRAVVARGAEDAGTRWAAGGVAEEERTAADRWAASRGTTAGLLAPAETEPEEAGEEARAAAAFLAWQTGTKNKKYRSESEHKKKHQTNE